MAIALLVLLLSSVTKVLRKGNKISYLVKLQRLRIIFIVFHLKSQCKDYLLVSCIMQIKVNRIHQLFILCFILSWWQKEVQKRWNWTKDFFYTFNFWNEWKYTENQSSDNRKSFFTIIFDCESNQTASKRSAYPGNHQYYTNGHGSNVCLKKRRYLHKISSFKLNSITGNSITAVPLMTEIINPESTRKAEKNIISRIGTVIHCKASPDIAEPNKEKPKIQPLPNGFISIEMRT